jgi:transposase-like protein
MVEILVICFMVLTPIVVACPHCGSTSDIVDSCKPECCFNHVCASCDTTFELVTRRIGEITGALGTLPAEPDPSNPTAACARCGECRIFAIGGGPASAKQYLCVSCKAVLALDYSEIMLGDQQRS